jgi:hypothetical protein
MRVADAFRALLANLIDYAGLYPPASLPLEAVLERYRGFRASPESWMLNRLVLPAVRLPEARLDPAWRITLLVDDDPGPLPPQIETLETRSLYLESALPVYYEAPIGDPMRAFAKVRTGGLTPDAIPSANALAEFLSRRVPFKATAGLHHPLRSERPLTYALDSPRAPMHGFLNVFAAAVLAWHGAAAPLLVELLEERAASALEFSDDALVWRGHRVTTAQIAEARRAFAHSFGSCSFEEPVTELRELGLLP